MLTNLHLLFIARQGYWKEEKEISPKHLWVYLLPYLAWSAFLLFLYLFFRSEVLTFLASYQFLGPISYRQLTEVLLYGSVLVGISYENFYLVKTKTPETLGLFFAVPAGQLALLLWWRNAIIILPALVAGLFFTPWLPLLLFVVTQTLSFPLLNRFYRLGQSLQLSRNWASDWQYIRTVVDDLTLIKAALLPLASLFLFFLWLRTGSDLDFLNPTKTSPLFTALFVGSLAFYAKSPAYYFLSLWQDFPYLQVLGLNLTRFLLPKLLGLALLSYGLVALPFLVYYGCWQGADLGQMLSLALALWLLYGLLQSFQWRESLFFKGKYMAHAKEIEAYRLPLVYYVRRICLSLSLTAFAFLFARQTSLPLFIGFALVSLVVQALNYRYFLKQYHY
ncbi:hypothetical protein [Streptococcus cuniculipharyngis]|uniref:Uncharacterized protein n=1 Tax=Streptococcus cuniculipharyngis TaxID=1562651 RepID=A0A5C5S839_9STRE|nr:hypothetical protein [Streptococcus cuniculipharyngis]TWS96276.1 hypothetical protein FRX57_07335 [Streptococcus cuniculipharyngis]